jgi:hypothetical protein
LIGQAKQGDAAVIVGAPLLTQPWEVLEGVVYVLLVDCDSRSDQYREMM